MTFCLDTTIIKPENNFEIKNAIILLHGYGGDGKDISVLSLNWKRHLPNTVFICPNGHERCHINPSGYQWFDLSNEDPKYILAQSQRAEKKLSQFIDEVKKEYNCIVGFSGKIIDPEDLKLRKKVATSTLLIHGDADQVVMPDFLLEAKDFFIRNDIEIETHIIKNCDHHIPIEASSIALNYILKKF